MLGNLTVKVTDAPYCAKGDGVTNDRNAIQKAIDDVHTAGSGTVILTSGKTFFSSNLFLKSNVHIYFEDGSTLYQSPNSDDYVKPTDGNGYEPHRVRFGNHVYPDIKWSHAWYYEYPMLFGAEGTHDVKISGNGTIRMMNIEDEEKIIMICPIGFYKSKNIEVSDLTITNYHSYAMMVFTCWNGLFKNLKINNSIYGNGDGINLMNCQHMRVTGCTMSTGDDSVYIFVSYKDPRGGAWWSSDEPQPSIDIEIDHNDLKSNHCKAFGMILWGADCPDQSKVEVRDLYVHDNHFASMGNWNYNPYTEKEIYYAPVTHVKFENNIIDTIEENFFETQISDMSGFRSMKAMHNGDFENGGSAFWSMRKNSSEDSAGVSFNDVGQEGSAYGYIKNLENGDAAIYQGLYITTDEYCTLRARVQTSGDPCRLFVKDLGTQTLIASKEISNTEWEYVTLEFRVPENANYHVGLEKGNATKGWARIDNARLMGNFQPANGYKRVILDRGKVVYVYNEIEE